ncbi:MAG TPA: MarC family protein [Vicinamibacterales bacterium]
MIGPAEIFTILFVMLGPMKVLGPFAQRTRGIDDAAMRRIAWWTFVVATVGIVTGSLLGRAMLQSWGVSVSALRLTGGVVFFLVALRQLLEQYEPAHAVPPETLPASPIRAAVHFVFPMVLTPYGIAAVIALLASSLEAERTVMILELVLLVMVLDLLAMLLARRILVGLTVVILQVFGAVLAVLQVALSVELILGGLRSLGVIAGES